MDALRKAELQKQQSGASAPVASGSESNNLSLEPLAEQGMAPQVPIESSTAKEEVNRRLPELPKRLEELDDQFFTADPALKRSIRALTDTKAPETESKTLPLKTSNNPSREAAQNVFAAKQPTQTIGHGFAITVSIATLIAIAAIGGYFYWQMQPKGGLAVSPGLAVQQAPLAPPPTPAAQAVPTAPAMTTAAAPATAPPVAALQSSGTPRKADVVAPRTAVAPSPTPPRAAAQQAQEYPDSVIRVNTKQKKADGTMEAAHAAFSRGEIDLARSIWLKTLQSDPRNINALHGLAALTLQEGKPDQAATLYLRVLEVDPKDAVAHAGLLSINTPADARQAESRLKGLLAEQPNSPHLHFALGNLYMNDARWSEAQQAFFKAHVADPANPDYLYNLAVSLDHLHQTNLAAQHYARALVAAQSQVAAFDSAKVEERLKALRNEHQR